MAHWMAEKSLWDWASRIYQKSTPDMLGIIIHGEGLALGIPLPDGTITSGCCWPLYAEGDGQWRRACQVSTRMRKEYFFQAPVTLGFLMQGTSWGGDVIVMVNVIYLDHYELELLVQNEVSEECILSPGNALGCLFVAFMLIDHDEWAIIPTTAQIW